MASLSSVEHLRHLDEGIVARTLHGKRLDGQIAAIAGLADDGEQFFHVSARRVGLLKSVSLICQLTA